MKKVSGRSELERTFPELDGSAVEAGLRVRWRHAGTKLANAAIASGDVVWCE